MKKKIVERDRPQMTIPKVTNTHSEYVILIAFPVQQRLHKSASMLRHTYNGCVVTYVHKEPLTHHIHVSKARNSVCN